jgi:polysaccharide biosynthesis transport protein
MEQVRRKKVNRQGQNTWNQLVFIVFYHLRLILTVFSVVFTVSVLIAVFLPPSYRSSAKFSVSLPQQMDPLQREASFDYKNRVMRFLQDQKEIVLSNKVLTMAAEKVYPQIKPEEIAQAVLDLRKNLEVTPPSGETSEGSSVYIVSYTGSDSREAARIADAITDAYMVVYRELTKAKTDYSYEFFKQQTQELSDEMAAKERALRQYEVENAVALVDILNLEPGKTNLEVGPYALLTQFTRKSHELQEELVGLKTSLRTLEGELKHDKIPLVPVEMEGPGRALTAFKNRVAQLQIQLNEMKPQFSGQYEPLRQVKEELELNVKSLREEMGRSVQAQELIARTLEARIQELGKLIGDLQERIRLTAEERSKYEHLKQDFSLARDAYANSRNQMEQARLANALNQENQYLTLVEKPEAALKPSKPNRPLLLILGLFAGVFLALGTALTTDYFDHTIKTPEDVEVHLETSVIWSIPRTG